MKTINNTVIANRKKTDWPIIKNYFESRGVDVGFCEGTFIEGEANAFYYGTINSKRVSWHSLKRAQQANATILEVSDIEKEFKVGDVVVGWHNRTNKDRLYEAPWEIERISSTDFIYPKNRPYWCCDSFDIRHATPKESAIYYAQIEIDKALKNVSETVTVPKSFVIEAHKSACTAWKKRIEEVVPELFPKTLPKSLQKAIDEIGKEEILKLLKN